MIELSAMTLKRGRFVLDIPEWKVGAGEVVAVVGPNGSGKTTLFRLLGGFLRPTSGTVRVDGMNPYTQVAAVRRRLGWMTDDMPMFGGTLADNLSALASFYPTFDRAFARHVADRLEMPLDRRLDQLSKGEGVRARLVCALAHRPSWLVLDEPATGLDVPSRRALLGLLMELMRDEQRSVLISSHHATDVERIADRYLFLCDGTIVDEGPASRVLGNGSTLEDRLAEVGR